MILVVRVAPTDNNGVACILPQGLECCSIPSNLGEHLGGWPRCSPRLAGWEKSLAFRQNASNVTFLNSDWHHCTISCDASLGIESVGDSHSYDKKWQSTRSRWYLRFFGPRMSGISLREKSHGLRPSGFFPCSSYPNSGEKLYTYSLCSRIVTFHVNFLAKAKEMPLCITGTLKNVEVCDPMYVCLQ